MTVDLTAFQRDEKTHPNYEKVAKCEPEKIARITFNTTEELHRKIKMHCLQHDLSIKEYFNELLKKEFKCGNLTNNP